jgi:hypothetical protein
MTIGIDVGGQMSISILKEIKDRKKLFVQRSDLIILITQFRFSL